MQNRSKVINKLALVFLSIVVLELILIGDRVQPVKAIKKKIYLKKLKKMLPLLALMKPKKKLILVPIPIPMFNKHPGHHYPYSSGQHHQMGGVSVGTTGPHAMTADSSAPMSFIMEPMGFGPPTSVQSMPMAMMEPAASPSSPTSSGPMTMMMPSMTMTISSDGGGGTMSAIELSTSNQPSIMMSDSSPGSSSNSSSQLGALMSAPQPHRRPSNSAHNRWPEQLQQQQVQLDNFDLPEQLGYGPAGDGGGGGGGGGEHYYSSPWASARQPLTSPAKLLRTERLRQGAGSQRPITNEPAPSQRFRPAHQPAKYQSQAGPAGGGWDGTGQKQQQQHQHQQQQQQQIMAVMNQPVKQNQNGRLKQPQQQQQQFSAPMPVLIIRNQLRPSKAPAPPTAPPPPPPTPPPAPAAQLQSGKNRRQQQERIQQQQQPQQQPAVVQQHLSQQQEQQIQQALEYEELIPVGPPQLMPIYQTPNGRLHMTPPTPPAPASRVAPPPGDTGSPPSGSSSDLNSSFEHHDHEREGGSSQPAPAASGHPDSAANFGDTSNSEVQTIGSNANSNRGGGSGGTGDNSGGQLFQPALSSPMNEHRSDGGEHDEGPADRLATATATTTITPTSTPATSTSSRFTLTGSGKQQQVTEAKRKAEQLAQGGY